MRVLPRAADGPRQILRPYQPAHARPIGAPVAERGGARKWTRLRERMANAGRGEYRAP
jgi:hypothetical protein